MDRMGKECYLSTIALYYFQNLQKHIFLNRVVLDPVRRLSKGINKEISEKGPYVMKFTIMVRSCAMSTCSFSMV